MKRLLALIAFAVASPAAAERITTFWKLEPVTPTGARTVDAREPLLVEKMLPVRLVRLREPAVPAGSDKAVPAGAMLYLVVNSAGATGFCTLKDRSSGHQAKTLFIPVADQRPCFVDRDGDGRFDASFSAFEPYTRLSPPQARGSVDAAQPLAVKAAYEPVDIHEFTVPLTISYRLILRSTLAKSWLRATVDRPGHSDEVDIVGTAAAGGVRFAALGALVTVRSADKEKADVQVLVAPAGYVYGNGSRTVFVPSLPHLPALRD